MTTQQRETDHWERHILRMQALGLISQRTLALAAQPDRDWPERGYGHMRALAEAHRCGYFEKPSRLAWLFGKRWPARLTSQGCRWLEWNYAGLIDAAKVHPWLEKHGLTRADFRELLD
jgi:hypothetical protein